jgi:deoxyxylulose-5-phosphate synthase
MRNSFVEVVKRNLKEDSSLLVLLGDISVAAFFKPGSDELLEHVYNCGILEQSMVSFAAGTASLGYYPVIQTITPFLVERAFEQIKLDVVAQNNPCLLVGVGGGLEYSKLGYTHHCIWDTDILSNLEGIQLFVPTTKAEASFYVDYCIKNKIAAYIRLTDSEISAPSDFNLVEFNKISTIRATGASECVVFCGAFKGQSTHFQNHLDIFSFASPYLIPDNINILSNYKKITVYEYITQPNFSLCLKKNFENVLGYYQKPSFFRGYGDEAAIEHISNNWVLV